MIIEHEGKKYKVVKEIIQKDRVIVNGWDVTEYEDWYDEKYCIEAVKQDGDALQFVRDQTPAICIEAVKEDGYALQYVRDQTPAICIEAVKQDGYALRYVRDQTPAICIEAVKQDGYALRYVDKRVFTK